ncbi:MAG: glycosyl hydrolase [Candidatus Moranbacteria bacterium]|nr:glycosyl hydrolase [Candidatus Moranbacteria bacterium]
MVFNYKIFIIAFVLILFFIGGFNIYFSRKNIVKNNQVSVEQSDIYQKIINEDINKLEQKTALTGKIYVDDPNIPAPTNQWFSSVIFEKTSQPIFAYPMAVKMNNDGFGFSYPSVVSTQDTVFASYKSDLKVVFQKNELVSSVSSFDDMSVGVLQKNGENTISKLKITHGSPFVYISVLPGESFNIQSEELILMDKSADYFVFASGGKFFAFFPSLNEMSVKKNDDHSITVSNVRKEALISIAVLPNLECLDIFSQYALDPIIGTNVDFNVTDNRISTKYEIVTKSGGKTLFALLPNSYDSFEQQLKNQNPIGEYDTLRGKQLLYQGRIFDFSEEAGPIPRQLEVSFLSHSDKENLRNFIKTDADRLTVTENDTYFVGKKLFAMANVLDIAEQLGMERESDILKIKLKTELETWKNNTLAGGQQKKYFYYDPIIKGIVGETASFGSELFNDHNFHYGYFIYAASILSRYDNKYLSDNQTFINLLVKDIANNDRDDKTFPYLRGFDAYEGHSWASGFGMFADGNNQESSSEAVNAWYALYLWSDIIGNKNLKETAEYLYFKESSSALDYWLNIDKGDLRFENFQHSMVALVWGGKLDFATWFSPHPEAMLGIQLIPFSPASGYLGRDAGRVQENLSSENAFQSPALFKDYLAMYRAFYDVTGARQMIDKLKPTDIDSANSRSFMEAWLLVLENKENH